MKTTLLLLASILFLNCGSPLDLENSKKSSQKKRAPIEEPKKNDDLSQEKESNQPTTSNPADRLKYTTWELDFATEEFGPKTGSHDQLWVRLVAQPYSISRGPNSAQTVTSTINFDGKNTIDILQTRAEWFGDTYARLNKLTLTFTFPTENTLEFYLGEKLVASYVRVD
ncbi:MAG: hypothetical protein AB7T49_03025 [Oligoflexales bacterium]